MTSSVRPLKDRARGSGLLGKRTLVALVVVLFLECALVAVWVSALGVQIPRNMPFGVTGSSPVVTGYQV